MLDPAVTHAPDDRPPLLRTMVGEVLRRIRLEQRRTLADVARTARVSMPYLSELERGRKEASSEVLAAICGALRIDLSDLLAEVGRDLAGQRPAQVIRLGSAVRRHGAFRHQVAPPASRPGDVQALLAA
jgi:transcriptional regulator with XRE-family HTH domain